VNEVSSSLYWSLPGPAGFRNRVSDAARNARALFLNFPQHMPVNPRAAVEQSLVDANVYDPVLLTIQEGMNISREVGVHFGGTNMPAQSLVHHHYGAAHAVVLFAAGLRSQSHCEKYAKEFMDALKDSEGDVRLVVALQSADFQHDMQEAQLRVIAFDGGLTASEMQAYVMQRMVSYEGPGSTSLYRHLVMEYASFDAKLAERLCEMDSNLLLSLPQSLDAMLSEELLRWSKKEWVMGTLTTVSSEIHPLYEWYVARHPGPDAAYFNKKSRERYWRACVKALIPWLEERRARVISTLHGPLMKLANSQGQIKKMIGRNELLVEVDGLEFNDIAFFCYSAPSFSPSALSQLQRQAVDVSKLAKKVRDDIAHLRAPDPALISDLITEMDSFVANAN
jgi:hypothetical protein